MSSLLILGQDGQLAKSLARRATGHFTTVEVAGRTRADLTRPGAVADLITRLEPDAVINAAAYTDVDGAETQLELAMRMNSHGPGEAAKAAKASGARFVHVSTDYVFGAGGDAPFDEFARPAPINAYGRTKLEGERAVLGSNSNAAVVRTAGVFSGGGRDFPSAIWSRAAAGHPLRVVHDQMTCPTFVDDLADALINIALQPGLSGIFHCAGQPGTSWYDFAVEAVCLMDKPVDMTAVTSNAFPRAAERPRDSRLASTRTETILMDPSLNWRTGLKTAFDVWRSSK